VNKDHMCQYTKIRMLRPWRFDSFPGKCHSKACCHKDILKESDSSLDAFVPDGTNKGVGMEFLASELVRTWFVC